MDCTGTVFKRKPTKVNARTQMVCMLATLMPVSIQAVHMNRNLNTLLPGMSFFGFCMNMNKD